jgi:hypothetical protein
MSHATEIIRRELPHLTPMVIDGAIAVLCPTLIVLKVGAVELVKRADDSFASWALLIICDCGVAALTALSGFRSKTFSAWQEGKKRRDETEAIAKAQTLSEGHLR